MEGSDRTESANLALHGQKVLIFGAAGQDGRYVDEACRRLGGSVRGVSRSTDPACDVSHADEVEQLIGEFCPDYVFHLAAESRTAHAALFENHAAIATGALNILESIRRHAPSARVLLVGSAVQFRNTGAPINERDVFQASSPYAASRIYSVYLARYFREHMGISTYIAYLFHHESPFRSAHHTSMMIASAAARAALGRDGSFAIGDIGVEKEWAFAGDIVQAMLHLVLQDKITECVIGTGQGYTIKEWLNACYGYVGLDWHDYVRSESGFVAEYKRLVSDPETIFSLGWRPGVGISELAALLVDSAKAELIANGSCS